MNPNIQKNASAFANALSFEQRIVSAVFMNNQYGRGLDEHLSGTDIGEALQALSNIYTIVGITIPESIHYD